MNEDMKEYIKLEGFEYFDTFKNYDELKGYIIYIDGNYKEEIRRVNDEFKKVKVSNLHFFKIGKYGEKVVELLFFDNNEHIKKSVDKDKYGGTSFGGLYMSPSYNLISDNYMSDEDIIDFEKALKSFLLKLKIEKNLSINEKKLINKGVRKI